MCSVRSRNRMLGGLALSLLGLVLHANAAQAQGKARDPRLAGTWQREARSTVGDQVMITVFRATLSANGNYRYVVQSFVSSNSGTIESAPNVITGTWSSENGSLYYRGPGQASWMNLGGYQIHGRDLRLTLPGGGKQYWEKR